MPSSLPIRTARQRNPWPADYFSQLAALVEKSLEALGYPPCPDGLTAANPRWCQSLKAWKETFSDWLKNLDPEKIIICFPIFDFRPIFGSTPLAEELRDHLSTLVEQHPGCPQFPGQPDDSE